ncbi:MFS general substrate transporter [Obba rivulosa]|uniref:MFS general substrate transporter n=1 Tax=Obba rivulosa TaxID=1052685 RepID=A0A8E2DHI8_9APHY|nr:MFS general substrate transporter [Obba rivulosa]
MAIGNTQQSILSHLLDMTEVGVVVSTIPPTADKGNVGLSQFEYAKEAGVRVSREDNARIARKIDLWILPMLCISQGLSILDKTALNYGNLYGMQASLNLTGDQFDWFASVFYLGYLVGNYPDGWFLQHYRAGRVLSITTFIWGIIILTTPACTGFGGVLANRFFLGIFEAVVTPGLTILTSIWYSQSEVPFRAMIWYTFNGWSGILGGFIAYGIGTVPNPSLPRWEYIFLILGSLSVAFAIALWFLFPDSPVEARFLNEEERILAVKRVAEAKLGMKNTQFKGHQIKAALVDPKTWLLLIATIAAAIPNGVVSNFSTIIIKGMGFTTLQSTLLDAAANGVLVVSLLVAGWICTHYNNMRIITMAVGNITCIIAAAFLAYLPTDQKWNRLVAYWFTSFQSVGFALGLVMISNNIGGFTKKTFTTALIFIGYCIGNESEAPVYQTGTKAMFIGYVIKTVAHILLGMYMLWSNMNKDRKYGSPDSYEEQLKGEEAGMHDMTEFENKYHRYVHTLSLRPISLT